MSKERDLRGYARSVFGENDDGSLEPDDAVWTAERVPLSMLEAVMPGGADGWRAWFASEVSMRRADLAAEAGNGQVRCHWEDFAEAETDEEIVVAVDEDGSVQLWDGFHRTAGAFVRGARDIPAVVGRPAPGLSLRR